MLVILTVRGVRWFVEQPGSSKLLVHPEMVWLMEVMANICGDLHFQRLLGPELDLISTWTVLKNKCCFKSTLLLGACIYDNKHTSRAVGWDAGELQLQSLAMAYRQRLNLIAVTAA